MHIQVECNRQHGDADDNIEAVINMLEASLKAEIVSRHGPRLQCRIHGARIGLSKVLTALESAKVRGIQAYEVSLTSLEDVYMAVLDREGED